MCFRTVCAPHSRGSPRRTFQVSDLSHTYYAMVANIHKSRFILNLPEEELASLERVCFQVEQASVYARVYQMASSLNLENTYRHWYYEDFIREQNPAKFPSYSLKTFSEALFKSCPLLHQWANDHDRTFQSFMQYKTRVPVCGAIMLNDTWEKVSPFCRLTMIVQLTSTLFV